MSSAVTDHQSGDADGPGYLPAPEPEFAFGQDEDRDAAFKALSAAIEACPGALRTAVAELSPDDVAIGLTALPLAERGQVLLPLGLRLAPRKVGTHLAADVLARLQRADTPTQRRVASKLSKRFAAIVIKRAIDNESQPDEAEVRSPRLLRLSVWSRVAVSALGARVWHWASQQTWFAPPGVDAAAVQALAIAAQALIDHTPDLRDPGDRETGWVAPGNDETANVRSDEGSMAQAADVSSLGVELTNSDLTTLCDQLQSDMAAAVLAAERVASALHAESPPEAADLRLLGVVRSGFDEIRVAASACGARVSQDNLAALRAGLADLAQSSTDEATRGEVHSITRLSTVESEGPLHDQLTGAQELASALLEADCWTTEQRAQAEALVALVRLARGTDGLGETLSAQQTFANALPDLALLAISASALVGLRAATANPPTGTSGDASEMRPASAESPAALDSPPDEPAVRAGDVPVDNPSVEAIATVNTTESSPVAAGQPNSDRSDNADEETVSTGTPAAMVDIDGAIAQLVGSGRHAFAAQLEQASGRVSAANASMRLASLAAAVRTSAGPVAAALRRELSRLDVAVTHRDTASLLLAAPALLRMALVTGEPAAGALMLELAPHLEEHLGEIATQVGRRAVQGVLLEQPPLLLVSDSAEIERSLRLLRDEAQALLRPRKLRYKRAGDIARAWMSADGFLGRALHVVAADERSEADTVDRVLNVLTDKSGINREIETQDRATRGGSSKPLQGAGRIDLVALATEAAELISRWLDAVASLNSPGGSGQWTKDEIASMRQALMSNAPAALKALAVQTRNAGPFVAASATAAGTSLRETVALVEGETALLPPEPSPAAVFGLDLLTVTGAHVDPGTAVVTLPDNVTDDELVRAASRTWIDAVRGQVAAENFDAANYLIRAARTGLLHPAAQAAKLLSEDLAELVSSSEHGVREELTRRRNDLGAALRTARFSNHLSEDQDTDLTSLLRAADPNERALDRVRHDLEEIESALPHYREEASARLEERLTRVADGERIDSGDVQRVESLIAAGDLATAEELVYFLEIGEPVPKVREPEEVSAFFPAVPDALPQGISPELVATIRARGTVESCPVLDYADLSADLAGLTAAALEQWSRLGATSPEGRANVSEPDQLLPALRVLGIEGKKVIRRPELPRGRDRRFVDVHDVTITGKAMVPAFGSKLGGRLRVLLAWGQPSAEMLMSQVDQDPSGEAVLVAYFGTMSAQARADLAVRSPHSAAPVVVLDDAALAYLAARGERQMDSAMAILLPFAMVNPYVREKRGLVSEEMFYGRDAERRSVLDPEGTQIIYGGRGLGKSALLRDAQGKFERSGSAEGQRVAIYLSLDTIGMGAGPALGPTALWDAVLTQLADRGIVATKRSGRQIGDAAERVRSSVTAWLEEDSARRLLILLDECDRFFEADSPQFIETSKLRQLGTTTHGRAKVVFAGLHSVQRYAKVAGNGPFSHLAQRPTVIGWLQPQYASNLLTSPMGAMGYKFAEPDLVNRVLAYCSYQPYLLQMFGRRLLERMHEARRTTRGSELEGPPYVVTREDIEAVQAQAELREDISTAFRDTLHLDPRYNVIANVLAHYAYEAGIDARLSDVELREECLDWWPTGFAPLDVEAFRAYVLEMVGLGILARNSDGRGWHLRGPNVLSMIGSHSDVMTQLVGAETLAVPEEVVTLETRAELPDGRRAPLTVAQMDDVLGDHANQVRVVLGSAATGIGDVQDAIRSAAGIGNRFAVPQVNRWQSYMTELEAGRPGDRRVVVDNLLTLGVEACDQALEAARTRVPMTRGVTRSVVLISSPAQMEFWRHVLVSTDEDASVGTVALRRHDETSLRVWTMSSQCFRREDRLSRLLQVTGGWPVLVERAAALVNAGGDEAGVMDDTAAYLSTKAGAQELVRLVGVDADEDLARAFADLILYIGEDSVDLSDLHAAVADTATNPVATVTCLQALAALDTAAEGKFRIEPVLATAWNILVS